MQTEIDNKYPLLSPLYVSGFDNFKYSLTKQPLMQYSLEHNSVYFTIVRTSVTFVKLCLILFFFVSASVVFYLRMNRVTRHP